MAVRGENSLFFATGLDNSGLQRGIGEAAGMVQGLGATISRINPFAALAVGAITVFTTIANEAFQFAKKYETAMLEVRTISKAVDNDFQGFGDQIFEISKKTLDDPVKLAQAYYQIVSAGYDGAEGIRVLETASKAAVAGVTDTQTAADGLTTVMNAFGVEVENVDRIADSMFKTVELGKTNFQQLSQYMSQAAPLASSLGVSYNEILAAVATLTKQGVPTAQAFTQIRSALVGVNRELGDGWANAYTFQDAMVEVSNLTEGSTKKLEKAVGSIEAVSAVLGLTGKNAQGAAKDLDDLELSVGSTDVAFNKMIGGNVNQWQIFSNNIRATTQRLGEFIRDGSTGFAKTMNSLFKETDTVSRAMAKQSIELGVLKQKVLDTNISQEDRLKLINELKEKYPDLLDFIDADTTSNEELKVALENVNKELINRIVLQKKEEEIIPLREEAAERILQQSERENKIREKTVALSQKNNIELDYNLSLLEQAEKLLSGLFKGTGQFGGTPFTGNTTNDAAELQNLIDVFRATDEAGKDLDKTIDKITKEKRELALKLNIDTTSQAEVTENIAEVLKKISESENIRDLSEYLKSDNEKLRKAAQERIEILRNSLGGGDDDKTYKDFLEAKRLAYEQYENQIVILGQKRADEINKNLIKESKTYFDFLKKQLESYRGAIENEKAITQAAKRAGITGFNTPDTQKVAVEVQPQVDDIRLSQNAISRLIRKLEEELSSSGVLSGGDAFSDISRIAEAQLSELTRVNQIKKLKLQELSFFESKLSKDALAERKKEILEQNKELTKGILDSTQLLLEDIPRKILDSALYGTELTFDNLNAATLGQLNEIEKKLQSIKLDSGELLDLGLDEESVDQLLTLFDTIKQNASNKIDTAQAQEIGSIFGEIGAVMSRAGDEISASIGDLVSQLGVAFAALSDENASGLQKASGLVGLIIQAGQLMNKIGDEDLNAGVRAQQRINDGLFDQIQMEQTINQIRREREEIERNSSAFLESYYKDDFTAAIEQQIDSEKRLNESMERLAKNGIFTAEGIGKRLLGGTKTENRSFSIEDILGNLSIPGYFGTDPARDGNLARGRFFDPLSIFGGFSDLNVSKDALNNLRSSFDDALRSMGKTSADMAQFSSIEWLDFFSIMEDGGKITDEATSKLLDNAKESLEEYNEAVEEMRSIIGDFAGSLGDDLGSALVNAFESGGDAAKIFMEDINDIINQLFLNQLIDTQFRSYFDDLQKEMEQSFQIGGDQSWIDDIQRFANGVSPAMDQAVSAMEAFNSEMQDLGYDGFNDAQNRQGLVGQISTITEDTANVLAGAVNGIRVDVSQGLEASRAANLYLAEIQSNTKQMVEQFEVNNQRLLNIEKSLS